MRGLLNATDGVTAIYNAGAGNTGLQRVLADQPKRPIVVTHELTSHARQALEAGQFD